MSTVFITGANRGLGLEWVRQFAEAGWRVHASCRHPEAAEALAGLRRLYPELTVHRLDVTDPEQIAAVAAALVDEAIDVLVNNAGVYLERWGRDAVGGIDYAAWERTLAVNTLGPMRVSEALLPMVARSQRRLIVAISSHMGSIADITQPRDYAYRSSKAALNAAMKGLALELAPRGVGVLLLHPGWVRTRMGGAQAPLTTAESVAGMRRLVEGFTPDQSGRFLRYDGTPMPW